MCGRPMLDIIMCGPRSALQARPRTSTPMSSTELSTSTAVLTGLRFLASQCLHSSALSWLLAMPISSDIV